MGKKLLILGEGGHGQVVKEVAQAIRRNGKPVYDIIDFLDDNHSEAVGKIEKMEQFRSFYDEVFCGIGNNSVRKRLLEKAKEIHFTIATLIHPSAYVSSSAVIEAGTVIEPKAIVNANTIVKKGCIISVGAIVDHDVVIEEYVHVNAGAICKAGSHIQKKRKLEAGEVVMGYPATVSEEK